MAKVYLVDSENIGSGWSQLLASMTDEDRMYVFYTDKSPYISYENLLQVIAYCSIPVFLKCYEGKNALDFQLVSELGFKLCETPDAEFIIVSDDYGYDPAAKYWSERGYNVCRIGKKLCKPALPKQDNRSEQTEVVAVQTGRSRRPYDRRNRGQQGGVAAEKAEGDVKTAVVDPVAEPAAVEQELPEAAAGVVEEAVAEPAVTVTAVSEEAAEEAVAELAAETSVAAETPAEESIAAEVVVEETVEQSTEALEEAEPVAEPVTEADEGEVIAAEVVAEEVIAAEEAVAEEPSVEEAPVAEAASESEEAVAAEADETAEASADAPVAEADDQANQKESQPQKRSRERRKRNKKETVRETEKAEEADEGYKLDLMLVDIARRSGSTEPENDARCVKELFYTIKMNDITNLNTALKILIGNEMGNDIYRELKEHTEYREQLDALYCPVLKNRFIHYVQIVLDRSGVKDVTADDMGNFLLNIPRKNLNSIRSAMLKEYGHENGAAYYTVLKAHIKVLNKI